MRKIIVLIFGAVVFASCRKLMVEEPTFEVTTQKTTYKIGDTVKFVLTGNPGFITFYSGEPGFNYDYKDRTSAAGTPRLQFTSYQQNTGEVATLRLIASSNFNGATTDTNSVKAATWTDITSRAILSTGADNTASGIVDLSDFLAANKPLYLAFRYTGYQHATLKQPTWTIRTFNVTNVLSDSSVSSISTIDQLGWQAIDFKNPSVAWTVPTSGQVSINGTATGSVNADNDDWVISKPLDLKKAVPNVGVNIKSLNGNMLPVFTYIFKKAGTYKVTFVAINNSIDENKEVIRQTTLMITP